MSKKYKRSFLEWNRLINQYLGRTEKPNNKTTSKAENSHTFEVQPVKDFYLKNEE